MPAGLLGGVILLGPVAGGGIALAAQSNSKAIPAKYASLPWVQRAEGLVYDLKAIENTSDRAKVPAVARLKYYEAKRGDIFATRNSYLEANGKRLIAEETVIETGGNFTFYYTYQRQGEVHGWVKVEGDRVTFRLIRDEKETKKGDEGFDPKKKMVAPPQIFDIAIRKWSEVVAGNDIKFKVAIPHEAGSFRFKLSKHHHDKKAGHFTMALKPQSFFLRLFVSPFRFTFNTKTGLLFKVVGRVPVKRIVGPNKFEDMDAEILLDRMDRKVLLAAARPPAKKPHRQSLPVD